MYLDGRGCLVWFDEVKHADLGVHMQVSPRCSLHFFANLER